MLDQRFTSKYAIDPTSGCWVWRAARDRHGYGLYTKLTADWTPGTARHWMAHRYSYEAHRGPIPEGLVLDHLCRNTSCINPDHLEPVTYGENFRRGAGTGMDLWTGDVGVKAKSLLSHCAHGHEYTPENTYWSQGKYRKCRTCIAATTRRYIQRLQQRG